MEVFKDPHLIGAHQRPGLDDTVPAVTEWGLPTEPWTFVIDAQGFLRAKYEQFTPSNVIEAALLEALEFAHENIQEVLDLQDELTKLAGREQMEYEAPEVDEELVKAVKEMTTARIAEAIAPRASTNWRSISTTRRRR